MPRTLTALETRLFLDGNFDTHVKVSMKDASGNWVELTNLEGRNWVLEGEIADSNDQPVREASITLERDFYHLNLSPFVSASKINNPAGGAQERIGINREFKIETAMVPVGADASTGTYQLLFDGDADDLDVGTMKLKAVDKGGRLMRRKLSRGGQFSVASGDYDDLTDALVRDDEFVEPGTTEAIEDVIQAVLNDWAADAITLELPDGSPGWEVTELWRPKIGDSVMDVIRGLAMRIGWDCRYRWNSGSSAFTLQLYEPPRSDTAPSITLGADDYFDVSRMASNLATVKNVIEVFFLDDPADPESNVHSTRRSDAASVAAYGKLYGCVMQSDTQGMGASEALTLCQAILADLKEPAVDFAAPATFRYDLEIHDIVRFTANGIHFDTNQDRACVGFRHHFSAGRMETEITCREGVAGFTRNWGGMSPTEVFVAPTPTLSVVSTLLGAHLTLDDIAFTGYKAEYHVTTSGAGFTMDATTRKARVKDQDEVYIDGLTPHITHYARARIRKDGWAWVESNEVTFTPGLETQLSDPEFIPVRDIDASPVANRRIVNIDGVIQFADVLNAETAGVMRMKEPIVSDSTGSEPRKLKNDGGVFRALTTAGVEKPIAFGQIHVREPAAFVAPSGDGLPLSQAWDRGVTNYCKNPSFESNVTDFWENTALPATITRDTSTFLWGTAAAKLAMTGTQQGIRSKLADSPAVLNGETWTFSAYVFAATPGEQIAVSLLFYTAGDVLVGSSTTKVYDTNNLGGGWRRVFVTATAADATIAKVRCQIVNNNATTWNLYVDGCQLEKTPSVAAEYPTTYCDGTLGPAYTWAGTEHNSASTREGGRVDLGAVDGSGGRPVYLRDSGELVAEMFLSVGTEDCFMQLSGDGGSLADGGNVGVDALGNLHSNVHLTLRPKGDGRVKIGDGAAFRVDKNGSDQGSVGTGETLITWSTSSTPSFDLGGDFGSNLFTAPDSGVYRFDLAVYFNAIPDQQFVVIYLKVAGSRHTTIGVVHSSCATSQDLTVAGGCEIELAAGQTVGVYANTSGASRTVEGSITAGSWWSGRRVA